MPWKKLEFWLVLLLMAYTLAIGLGAAVMIVRNFPRHVEEPRPAVVFPSNDAGIPSFEPFGKVTEDQGLLLLAVFAGIAGSFLHVSQSLSSYVGNTSFKASWALWYFLRPLIGGVLGLAIYVVFRAGLVGGASVVNPYGVVSLGVLGGWFSKTTTDKLQEVFETLFKTTADQDRKNKLIDAKPVILHVEPQTVPAATNELRILGHNFIKDAKAVVNGTTFDLAFVSSYELKASLNAITPRPPAGTEISLQVKNPEGADPLSEPFKVAFV